MSTIAAARSPASTVLRRSSSVFCSPFHHDRRHSWDLFKEVHPGKAAGAAAAHVVMNPERWFVLLIGTVFVHRAFGVVEWFLLGAQARIHAVRIYRILLGIALLIWGAKYLGV